MGVASLAAIKACAVSHLGGTRIFQLLQVESRISFGRPQFSGFALGLVNEFEDSVLNSFSLFASLGCNKLRFDRN